MKKITLFAAIACLGAGAAGATASLPGYWTVAQTTRTVLSPQTKTIWFYAPAGANHLSKDWSNRRIVTKAVCRGMGVGRRGAYLAFFCAIEGTYRQTGNSAFTENVYVRLWTSAKVCASSRSLADCPPPLVGAPLPGDPRCGTESASCMTDVAGGKTLEMLRAGGFLPVVNYGCIPKTVFVYVCSWNPPGRADWPTGSTVRFVKGKAAWTTAVTLTR